MTPRDLRNIHTTRNSCRDALPCADMALKLPQYFYLLMEKPLVRYFEVWSSKFFAKAVDKLDIKNMSNIVGLSDPVDIAIKMKTVEVLLLSVKSLILLCALNLKK